jgi:hypothetical protein
MTVFFFLAFAFNSSFAASIIVDDFEKNTIQPDGKVLVAPQGWSEGNKDGDKIDYFLVKEDNNTFMRGQYFLKTSGRVIMLGKRTKLSETPFLSWKWRAIKFPALKAPDGFEESDNAATVYVLFRSGLAKYIIKYDWSLFNCKNNEKNEPFFFKSKSTNAFTSIAIRPLRTTSANLKCGLDVTNTWLTEKVNLYDDFKLFFGKDWAPENVEGIGVLIDGDQTETDGVSADFDDFVLSDK